MLISVLALMLKVCLGVTGYSTLEQRTDPLERRGSIHCKTNGPTLLISGVAGGSESCGEELLSFEGHGSLGQLYDTGWCHGYWLMLESNDDAVSRAGGVAVSAHGAKNN